jgi:hypothetical protein
MIDALFDVASPATLASLIADIQCLGTGASLAQLNWERRAMTVLRDNVGNEMADTMVQDAVSAAYTESVEPDAVADDKAG